MIKLCKRCGNFNHHRKHSRGGFICYCRECEKEKTRQRASDHKLYIVNFLGGECDKCGIKDHPCIYDAHHIDQDTKLYNCSLVSNKEILNTELSKCQLLCVKCHREIEHEKNFSDQNRIWKKCQKCNEDFWHEIRKRHKNIDTIKNRKLRNAAYLEKMVKNWELGKVICQQHRAKKWNYKEWDSHCKETFGTGAWGSNSYEKLFKEFSVDNLPSSLNGIKTKKYKSNLVDENNTTYVHNICIQCDNNRRRKIKNKVKDQAIAYLGGKCHACSSVFESRAFDFHHLDPSLKEFKIARKSSFNDKLVKELDKCVLLCCYCHRKVHSGVLSIIDPLTF